MALQISYPSPFNSELFATAYARIESIVLRRDMATIRVSVYADAASARANLTPLASTDYTIDGTAFSSTLGNVALAAAGVTPIAAAYAVIKLRTEYQPFVNV